MQSWVQPQRQYWPGLAQTDWSAGGVFGHAQFAPAHTHDPRSQTHSTGHASAVMQLWRSTEQPTPPRGASAGQTKGLPASRHARSVHVHVPRAESHWHSLQPSLHEVAELHPGIGGHALAPASGLPPSPPALPSAPGLPTRLVPVPSGSSWPPHATTRRRAVAAAIERRFMGGSLPSTAVADPRSRTP